LEGVAAWEAKKAARLRKRQSGLESVVNGDTGIARKHSQAQGPKTNIDLQLAKAIRLMADAGYRLTIERIPKASEAVATVTELEQWKRSREG
jgi:hypothetical protein